MRKTHLYLLLAVGFSFALSETAFAESRTVRLVPVTMYSDGTSIPAGVTVTYTVYWSASSSLTSLKEIDQTAQTSAAFDPDVQGMTRGATVYFTARATLSTGEQSGLSPAYPWVVPLLTPPPAPTLVSLAISGPRSVNEGATAAYTALATWDNNTTTTVTPTWSVSNGYATIGPAGVLTAAQVTGTQTVAVSASFSSGGVTKTATWSVSVLDVTVRTPAPPVTVDITGPVASSGSAAPSTGSLWQLEWTAVTAYSDGTPIEAGRTVRYNILWSTDEGFSGSATHTLLSSVSGTSLQFDPAAYGMTTNERVYFAVQTVLDVGDPSPLSSSITWRVSNTGPKAPTSGIILGQ